MDSMNFQKWSVQPCYGLSYQDTETCSPLSTTDDRKSPTKEQESNNSKKMAIPRLPEGAETAFSSLGRFHRRHVRRACESCRQRKTKCTGDKSGCRNCREAGIICCYTDGKREKSKRQLATLSAKVQAYEEVIRKISLRFGVSDEQLMSSAMTLDASQSGLGCQSDITSAISRGRELLCGESAERRTSRSPSTGSLGETDRVEEDFNRDESARATGFIGKSSEISWLQRLCKEVNGESVRKSDARSEFAETGQSSPPLTPGRDGQNEALIASLNYYADNMDMALPEQVDSHEIPPREVANRLFGVYLTSVHPSFPIIGMSTFVSQYQLFFSQPSVKPGNKWLAILNLIFAIAAVYSHLVHAEWEANENDHTVYFSRARVLSMKDPLFDHPDLQQLQVEGLTSFYLLATGQINRSWKVSGSAVRGAMALGLHLRNVGIYTSDTSKEIRYRVWWSLYTMDHLLSVMTGRPSCIVDCTCTTPLPIPFDESEFQREEVAQLLSNPSRKGLWVQDWTPPCSSIPSPSQADDPTTEVSMSKGSETGASEWLKSLPPSMSLYFFHLATLTSIAKRVNMKLYSAEAVQSPWPSFEFTIQSLIMETNSWVLNLPEAYDFTSGQTSQSTVTQKTGLAFPYYSTKIAITRPCLCRLEQHCQTDGTYDFCSKTGAECVESACQIIKLLPETPDAVLLNKISPWWCSLHYIMQATTVLLLELSFRAEHVPEKGVEVSQAAKKAVEWLHELSKSSSSAHRAWKLCDDFLRRLAPQVGIDVSDLPGEEPAIDPAVNFVAALDGVSCSLMDQQIPTPMPYVEQPDTLDFLQPEKQQSTLRNSNYDDYLPYDPATGQITGSFFPTSTNIDLDLGYMWDSSPVY
ncbi:hypothetical protein VTN77DRAFT_8055 [Rasamsonia byssochlamydoides]|uniref:uncharacterized protein n=1 Tax=Rasamsonia byssochlamydoides TaxID=89139 RepID=UPI00374401DF